MRNWIEGAHFPNAAKIEIQSSISDEARANLTDEQVGFLSTLVAALSECNWNESGVASCIKTTASQTGVGGRDAYVALYWAILGKSHGPKASSLMVEMGADDVITLLSDF